MSAGGERLREFAKRLTGKEFATDEAACDLLVKRGIDVDEACPGPTNIEGWLLWSATLRAELAVQTATWDPQPKEEGMATCSFTLRDGRSFDVSVPADLLVRGLEAGCAYLRTDLTKMVQEDTRKRKAEMAAEQARFAVAAPDLTIGLLGFRAWRVDRGELLPIGIGSKDWKIGEEVVARCTSERLHLVPSADCECGLYAWNSPVKAAEYGAISTHEDRIVGAIVASGRAEVHDDGFRAERARIVAVSGGSRITSQLRARLAEAGVPIVEPAALERTVFELTGARTCPPQLRPSYEGP